jgi:ABC-type transporter Mla subunit MlaD
MNNEASFTKIGAFILLGTALIVATLVYLGGMRNKGNEFFVETYFTTSVSGLDVGSEVNYRGVKIGSVKKISFVGAEYAGVPQKDGRNIYVLMALNADMCRRTSDENPEKTIERMISHGLRATVSASGITGLSHIEMNFPKMEMRDAKTSWKPRHLLIHPAPSILDSAADGLTKVLTQLNKMDLVMVWSNIVRMTQSAGDMCETVNTLVDSERDRVGRILENLDGATTSLRTFSETISDNPSLLIRSRDAEPLPETR